MTWFLEKKKMTKIFSGSGRETEVDSTTLGEREVFWITFWSIQNKRKLFKPVSEMFISMSEKQILRFFKRDEWQMVQNTFEK